MPANKPKKPSGAKIGILGYGQIGQAIAKFYDKPLIKDLARNDGLEGIKVLHVCIPYTHRFVSIVAKELRQTKPELTIIHSTVAPGTTKRLAELFSGMVVHSPVRGVHPHLHEGIRTFIKYIGADDKKAGLLAKRHLEDLGITTKLMASSLTTEVGKILDTTYYGLCIAWHGEKKKLCDKLGIDFDEAVTHFNQSYNDGYRKMGKHHVIRPVLTAPEQYIGGHCIIPNAKLLKKHFKSKAVDLVLDYQPKIQEN